LNVEYLVVGGSDSRRVPGFEGLGLRGASWRASFQEKSPGFLRSAGLFG
jgi:hypothetical protein